MSKPASKPKPQKTAAPGKPSSSGNGVLTDTATLRANARQNIGDGAITRTYLADKKVVIKLLNDALATEYVCVLRYYRHYFMASGMLADSIKAEFLEHAQQEQAHAHQLAERIVQLGGEPDLNPDTLTKRSHAEYNDKLELHEMIRSNLIAERVAIEAYTQIIALIGEKDHTTRRLIEQILEQEQEHADELSDWMTRAG